MTDNDPDPKEPPEASEAKRPRVSRWMVFRSVIGAIASIGIVGVLAGGMLAVYHPDTPLPREWNPTIPLTVSDPISPLTSMKLRWALADPTQCLATLEEAVQMSVEAPLEVSENCHVRNRVELIEVGAARIDRVETSCATALRMAMWERHGLQTAAEDILGTRITVIRQIGSYNCRPIRTNQGPSNRWSTHSTADAIDITGFDFADGRQARLIRDWGNEDDLARFLSAARDSACIWFATTLGPEFNALHADHFHLQARGWGTCR